MNIFIHSGHAALEYDQARLFVRLGHTVTGHFDVASQQRPKILGVTDRSATDSAGADVVVLHQTDNYHALAMQYLSEGKAVIAMAFGQGSEEQHATLAGLAATDAPLYVAAYSQKDWTRYRGLGAPINKARLIRFAKPLPETNPWKGDLAQVYVACNSIWRRGVDGMACNWPLVRKFQEEFPVVLSGKETEMLGGLGEVPFEAQAGLFERSRVFLAQGTVPAPYTLGLVEACAAGCPIVALDNGSGIADEGFDLEVARGYGDVAQLIRRLLSTEEYAAHESRRSFGVAQKFFDEGKVQQQWRDLLDDIAQTHSRGGAAGAVQSERKPVDGSPGDKAPADAGAQVPEAAHPRDRHKSRRDHR